LSSFPTKDWLTSTIQIWHKPPKKLDQGKHLNFSLPAIHGNKAAAAVLNQSRGIKMILATSKEPIVHQSEAQLYLDLLKRCLINTIYEDNSVLPRTPDKQIKEFDRDQRLSGMDWPSKAHTMIGWQRLNNIQALADDVLQSGIDGDFIETGVWRGGATIFMRGILKAYGIEDRTVWVADSFCGFPDPQQTSSRSYSSPEFKEIAGTSSEEKLALERVMKTLREGTQLEQVKQNFQRYNLLDQQVRFLPGWFHETLPVAPISKLALLRLDGDLYDSTYQALENLYPRLSVGGYVIVDDYHTFTECRQAVQDYFNSQGISFTPVPIDTEAVFWKRTMA
jgi:hypothetical protein